MIPHDKIHIQYKCCNNLFMHKGQDQVNFVEVYHQLILIIIKPISSENCQPLTLDLIVYFQYKCLQQLHLLALYLGIEGYTTLLLYLLLEFLSTGDLNGERRTFNWFLQRVESEKPCKLTLVAK